MKKLLSLLLAVCICLSCGMIFAGCTEDESNTSPTTPSSSTPSTPNGNSGNQTPTAPIVYSEGLEYALSEDRTYYIVTDMGTCKDKTVIIPPTYNDMPVKEIGYAAFGGGSFIKPTVPYVKEVLIPDSVTKIGKGAFGNNTYLTKVTIGSSVTSIESEAFYNCKNLEAVYISNLNMWFDITFAESDSSPFYDAKNAKLYVNNILLTDLVVPDSVTEIKANVFQGYTALNSIKIGRNVTKIGMSAFSKCSNLTKVEIGESVTTIESYAFQSCNLLLHVVFKDPKNWKYYSWRDGYVSVLESDLSTSTTAAGYLAETYSTSNWIKQS